MPKLQEKYDSKEAALKAFEALLIDAEGDDGGVALHDDVIKQFKVVNDTTGSLSAARKAEREAKAKLKKYEDALEGREIDDIEEALNELEEARVKLEQFGAGDDKNKIEEIVQKRVYAAEAKYKRDMAKLEKSLAKKDEILGKTNGKLSELTLDRAFTEHAEKMGVKPHSMKFLKRMVRDEFGLGDDGEIIHRTDAGRTIDDWLETEISENAFLTADLKAGGMGDRNNGGAGGKRTYKRAEFDTLSKENPAKASEVMASVRKGEAQLVD